MLSNRHTPWPLPWSFHFLCSAQYRSCSILPPGDRRARLEVHNSVASASVPLLASSGSKSYGAAPEPDSRKVAAAADLQSAATKGLNHGVECLGCGLMEVADAGPVHLGRIDGFAGSKPDLCARAGKAAPEAVDYLA